MLTEADLQRSIGALRMQNNMYAQALAHQEQCQEQISLNLGTICRLQDRLLETQRNTTTV